MSPVFFPSEDSDSLGPTTSHTRRNLSQDNVNYLDMAAELSSARKTIRKLSARKLGSGYDELSEENERLKDEVQSLIASKMRLVQNTAKEIERLRQFISLLSMALQGKGYTQRDIDRIEQGIPSSGQRRAISKHSSVHDSTEFTDDESDFESSSDEDSGESLTVSKGFGSRRRADSHTRRQSIHLLDSLEKEDLSVTPTTSTVKPSVTSAAPMKPKPKPKPKPAKPKGSGVSAMAARFAAMDEAKSKQESAQPAPKPKKPSKWGDPLSKPGTSHGGAAKSSKPVVREEMAQIRAKPTGQSATVSSTDTQTKSSAISSSSSTSSSDSTEPSKPLSLKERTAMFAASQQAVQQQAADRKKAIEASRGLDRVKVSADRGKIGALFEAKMKKDKEMSNPLLNAGADGAGGKSGGPSLKEALEEPTPEKAAVVLESMNLFTASVKPPDYSKKKKRKSPSPGADADTEATPEPTPEPPKLDVLNMNNNAMMKKMSKKEKAGMRELVCQGIVNNPDLVTVTMCNADVDDTFFTQILDALSENETGVKKLYFESNPISDVGFQRLARFIASDTQITEYKFVSNKKVISTPVLNEILDALNLNHAVEKFSFDGFRFLDQKDKLEKVLRRNADERRKARVAAKKAAAAAAAS